MPRSFPDTFRFIQKAKAQGHTAAVVWDTMAAAVSQSGMAPSGKAAALATYHRYIVEVYGAAQAPSLPKRKGGA